MSLCAKLNAITYVRRFSRSCCVRGEDMCWESETDARYGKENSQSSKHWKVTLTQFSIFLQAIRHSQCLGVQRLPLVKNFIISVVYNSIFTAALQGQKKKAVIS